LKAEPACIPCVLHDVFCTGKLATKNVKMQMAILKEASRVVAEKASATVTPSQLNTYAYRVVKRLTGIVDPYTRIKRVSNSVALKAAKVVERELMKIRNPEERFRRCVLYAIAGNVIDYGGRGHEFKISADLKKRLEKAVKQGLAADDVSKIFRKVRSSKNVLYLLDNSGEAAFDTLLIKEIKRYGSRVTAVVRGGPVSNDVTLTEISQIGLDKVVDEVITTGSDAYGIEFARASTKLTKMLNTCDLIISKGQANYEDLSEIEDNIPGAVAYLLKAKCEPVARTMTVKVGGNIANYV
jgi:uncharacterized protein with ATP-grasp and redox domains